MGCSATSETINTLVNYTSLAAGSYYGCVKATDKVGQSSDWVSSLNPHQVDTQGPSVLRVSSIAADAINKEAQVLTLFVEFSEPVTVLGGGDIGLLLETGGTDAVAIYNSGSGTSTLSFSYTIQPGHVASRLNYHSINALTLGASGSLKDAAGNSATLLLPAVGNNEALAQQKNLIIDTGTPTLPGTIAFAGTSSLSTSMPLTFSASTDPNFKTHNIKLCSSNNCSSGCLTTTTSLASPATVVGTDGGTFYACVQGEDLVGHQTNWVASALSINIDSVPPTILNVSSLNVNGIYKIGDDIDITVQFSESVQASNPGDITLILETGTTDRTANLVSGAGTDVLVFRYSIQAGDAAAELNYLSTSSLDLGSAGALADSAGHPANLALPALASAQSLAGQRNNAVDTEAPTAPSAVTFAKTLSNDTDLSISWSPSVDPHFDHNNLKLCTNALCTLGCISDSTTGISPSTLSGVNGGTYYACVQGEDSLGYQSAFVASALTATIDTTAPTVLDITSSQPNGYLTTGDLLAIEVKFSKAVDVTSPSDLRLALALTPTPRAATYLSGTGSDTLIFQYEVADSDTAADLDYEDASSLTLGANGTIRDAAGNNANLNLPAPGALLSLGGQKDFVVDTTRPINPASAGFSGALSSTTTVDLAFGLSIDTHFTTHQAKLCTAADCDTGCLASENSVTSPVTLSGVDGTAYYGCVRGQDALGLFSDWIASASTITIDSVEATVTNVSSTAVNAAYKVGSIIPLTVTFSKNVYVTSGVDIYLELETGGTDQLATYVSGHGTSTLLFNYTVQAGDVSSDLNYVGTASLQLSGTGAIKDLAGGGANITLPVLTNNNHIAGQKDIVIDTAAPAAPAITEPAPGDFVTSHVTVVSGTSEAGANIEVRIGATVIGIATADGAGDWSAMLDDPLVDGSYSVRAYAKDLATNPSPGSVASTFTVDSSAPNAPTITALNPVVYENVPAITGTSEPLIEVILYLNGTEIGTDTADGSGVWSITPAQPADGNHVLTARAKDVADRLSPLSASRPLGIDNAAPAVPANVTFDSTLSPSTSVSVNFDVSTDLFFKQHNLKLCQVVGCSASCTAESNSIPSPASLLGVDGAIYYACVQGEDELGHKSAWVQSAGTVEIDSNETSVVAVRATTAPGVYKVGQSIGLEVEFSRLVDVTSGASLRLALETGTTDREATYVGGTGTTTLTFTYAIQAGDASNDLNYISTGSLILNGATIVDQSPLPANILLPPLLSGSSLAGQSAIRIDTEVPTVPGTVGFAGTHSSVTSFPLSWAASTDANIAPYNVKLCSSSDCDTSCSAVSTTAALTLSLSGTDGSSYYGCVQAVDTAGHTSVWASSLNPIIVDTTVPTVTDVDSSLVSGSYKVGQVVPVLVTFSENVFVANGSDIILTMETGGTDRDAVYQSGSGTPILTFHYTVQAGDTAADLNVASTNALSFAASLGTIKDAAGSNANRVLPALGGAASLATHKNIVIDTAAPAVPSITTPASNHFAMADVSVISGSSEANATVSVYNGLTLLGTVVASGTTWTLNLATDLSDGVYALNATATDSAGNLSAASPSQTLTVDTSAPLDPIITSPNLTTADDTPSVSGTSEPDMDIILFADGVSVGTAVASSLGNWTVVSSDLADGPYAITAKAKDRGNRESGFSNSVTYIIDTAAPSNPSAVVFATAFSPSTSLSFSWAASTDPQLDGYNYKLCTAANCSTGCTAEASTATLSANVSGVNGTTYYACVQAKDSLGQETAFIASAGTSLVDTSAPSVSSVNSSTNNGYFKATETISIQVNFPEIVEITNGSELGLTLETGTSDRVATYVNGSGTTTLNFLYTVQATDVSSDLDYLNTTALSLGSGGTIKDRAGNNAVRTLASPGAAGSLGNAKSLVIDTIAPTAPASASFPTGLTNSLANTLSWPAATDTNLQRYNTQLCENVGCSVNCVDIANTTSLSQAKTGVSGTTYYGCVQARDLAGQTSAWVASAALAIDTSAPTVVAVSSTKADGAYNIGTSIPITVEFSKTVVVTSGALIGITLETGATDQRVIYTSGSNSNTLTFNYIVQSGDTAADLGYFDTAALTLGGGSIKDLAGNNAVLALPAQPGAGSLRTNKAIVIDTTGVAAPVISSPSLAYIMSNVTTVSGTAEASATIQVKNGGSNIGSATADGNGDWSATINPALSDGDYALTAIATDAANNVSPSSTTVSFEVDTSAPNAPVIVTHPFPTFDTTPTLSGTAEADMIVRLYADGVQVGSTTADGSGAWSITSSIQVPGTYSWTSKARDPGARESIASNAISGTIDTSAPSVTSVSSTTPNGTRSVGYGVTIQVNFSEAVAVTGTPTLTLETGSDDVVVNYSSGSGTSQLTFVYNIREGDISADLDYKSTSSLAGTIKDLAGNAAVLTLPALGSPESIGGSKAIVIDGIIPTVLSVATTKPNGTYGPTNVIDIYVSFSENVILSTGTPVLNLNTTPLKSASYISGSGTNVWLFRYTVADNDFSTRLEYENTSALVAAGTIRDAAGNDANRTLPTLSTAASLGGSSNLVIDGDSPAVTLSVNLPTQNAITNEAITAVNASHSVSGNDATPAPDSRAITYTCKFDTAIDGAVSDAAADCTSLGSLTFSSITGQLTWSPSPLDATSITAINPFEFKVTGLSSANRSGSTIYSINVLRRQTVTIGFTAGTEASFSLSAVTMANGKVSLNPLDQTDAVGETNWGFQDILGAGQITGDGFARLYSTGLTQNLVGAGSRLYDWVPWVGNLRLRIGFEDQTAMTHSDWAGTDFPSATTAQRRVEAKSFVFDGNDWANTTFTATGNMTVNFWMKSSQNYSSNSCASWDDGVGLFTSSAAGNVKDWGIHFCNGFIHAGTGNPPSGAEFLVKSKYQVNDDSWHMITMTRASASGEITIYVDGMMPASVTALTGALLAPANMSIARVPGAPQNCVGYLDELLAWDRVLTQDEILQIFERQSAKGSGVVHSRIMVTSNASSPWTGIKWKTPLPYGKELPNNKISETTAQYPEIVPNLMTGNVALYHLNESAAGGVAGGYDFADSSGNGNHGTQVGTLGFGHKTRFHKSPFFDGSVINLGAPSEFNFANTSFTTSLWFKSPTVGASNRIFSTGMRNGSSGFRLYLNQGRVAFGVASDAASATTQTEIITDDKYSDGQWHHAVAVVNRSTNRMTLYIDGAKVPATFHPSAYCGTLLTGSEVNISGCTYNASTGSHASIGGFYNGSMTDRVGGYIDEVALWNRALSATEVFQLYRRGSHKALVQVRTCINANCADGLWQGPANDSTTHFSELNNNASPATIAGAPLLTQPDISFSSLSSLGLSVPSRRYFQYKIILETDDTQSRCVYAPSTSMNCSPEVTEIQVLPDHYPIDGYFIYAEVAANFYKMNELYYTYGAAGCAAGARTYLGKDLGAWHWYNGTTWASSSGALAQSSTEAQISSGVGTFATYLNTTRAYVAGLLTSDGNTPCEVDTLTIKSNFSH